jgi:hypothetical protein
MKQENLHKESLNQSPMEAGKIDYQHDPRLQETASSDDRPSKKDQILQLHQDGITDVAEIAYLTEAQPSYIAEVLRQAGLLSGYFDLYTTTASEQNIYSRYFRNILAFKTVEAAEQSIEKIDRLYSYFERIGDRAGQHHAMVLALTGKNRARWSGKLEESKIFSDWLAAH